MEFSSHISGTPCIIRVDHYEKISPWVGPPETAPSADDYYGYIECEYTILDANGERDPELEEKLSDIDNIRIQQEIDDLYTSKYGPDY